MNIRIGQGIDSHRFGQDPAKPLIIGGVTIPGQPGVVSHSDGDLVYHAVSDAIIGAAGLDGDIGAWFKDTDEANLGIDSSKILSAIWTAAQAKGFQLGNVDLTITAQSVRIAPIREQIRANLAGHFETEVANVTVKAKTAEKMGALGRGEGLLCQAVVLLHN